jgi:hypothetical protein
MTFNREDKLSHQIKTSEKPKYYGQRNNQKLQSKNTGRFGRQFKTCSSLQLSCILKEKYKAYLTLHIQLTISSKNNKK